jgi:hypothetical protein
MTTHKPAPAYSAKHYITGELPHHGDVIAIQDGPEMVVESIHNDGLNVHTTGGLDPEVAGCSLVHRMARDERVHSVSRAQVAEMIREALTVRDRVWIDALDAVGQRHGDAGDPLREVAVLVETTRQSVPT